MLANLNYREKILLALCFMAICNAKGSFTELTTLISSGRRPVMFKRHSDRVPMKDPRQRRDVGGGADLILVNPSIIR